MSQSRMYIPRKSRFLARWLEKAADTCRRFNSARISGFEELQADEIRSFAGSKDRQAQRLDNELISSAQETLLSDGRIRCRERLG